MTCFLRPRFLKSTHEARRGGAGAGETAYETALRRECPLDSFYNQQLWQGIVAFQRYAGLKRTGTYTLETQKALHVEKLPEGIHPELGFPRIETDHRRQVQLFTMSKGSTALSRCQRDQIASIAKHRKNRVNRFAVWPTRREVSFAFNGEFPVGAKAILGSFITPCISMTDSQYIVRRQCRPKTCPTVCSNICRNVNMVL